MSDEHPNERLVTAAEDGEGFDRSLVSRRGMLGGSALLAGLLAYTSDPTDPQYPSRGGIASASHNPDEPLIILGPESDPVGYVFQDTAGGIILQDATSGNHFWYNQAEGRWETDAELNVPALTTESLVIGGTLYERDSNSPLSASSTTSTTYTVGGTYDEIIVIANRENFGFDQLQVNGDAGSNYGNLKNDDSTTLSAAQWNIPPNHDRALFHIVGDRSDEIHLSVQLATRETGQVIGGENANVSPPIDSFTLSDSGGSQRSVTAEVYGRAI